MLFYLMKVGTPKKFTVKLKDGLKTDLTFCALCHVETDSNSRIRLFEPKTDIKTDCSKQRYTCYHFDTLPPSQMIHEPPSRSTRDLNSMHQIELKPGTLFFLLLSDRLCKLLTNFFVTRESYFKVEKTCEQMRNCCAQ